MPENSLTRAEQFNAWVKTAKPGQVYIYHTGFLAVDRGTIINYGNGNVDYVPNPAIDNLGRDALSAFEANLIHLFQRKLHDRVYQYIAMKRRKV